MQKKIKKLQFGQNYNLFEASLNLFINLRNCWDGKIK